MTTPYDGKILLVNWKGITTPGQTVAETAALIRQKMPNVAGVMLRTSYGTNWQAVAGAENDLKSITGVRRIGEWVAAFAELGLEIHVWGIPRARRLGETPPNLVQEAKLFADAANVPGVKSLLLDVEHGDKYWLGTPQEVGQLMSLIRQQVRPETHIGLILDGRNNRPFSYWVDPWIPFIDSLHPMVYPVLFGRDWSIDHHLNIAHSNLARYGKPIFPMLQSVCDGDRPTAAEITRQGALALAQGAAGMSFYRLGSDLWYLDQRPHMEESAYTAITAIPLPPVIVNGDVRVPLTTGPSKLGPHFIGARGVKPWVDTQTDVYKFDPSGLGASGQVPAGPLVVGKFDQEEGRLNLRDWKAYQREGWPPQETARYRFEAQRNIFEGPNKPRTNRYLVNPRIDVWEDDNEVVPDNPEEAKWYAIYCIEMMRYYDSVGKKRANFCFAVGTPDIRPNDPNDIWPHLLPAVRHARDNGHYIALHEYMGYEADLGVGWKQVDGQRQPVRLWHGRKLANGQPDESYPYGYVVLRYRTIYDTYLRPHNLHDTPLLITECGCDSVEPVTPSGMSVGTWKEHRAHWLNAGKDPEAHYAGMLQWYDEQLRKDEFVKGAMVFTVGSVGNWANWDISGTGVEAQVLQYIAAERDKDYPPEGQDAATAEGFSASTDLDHVAAGQSFQGTWTFRNTGTTTWDGSYRLAYTEEAHPETADVPRSPLGAAPFYTLAEIGVSAPVKPGETARLTLTLKVPAEKGTYATNWQLQAPGGQPFGPLRWLRAVVEASQAPLETLEEWTWRMSVIHDPFNPAAALSRALVAAGYMPYGVEFRTAYNSIPYALQTGYKWATSERVVAMAKVPEWNNVRLVTDPGGVIIRDQEFKFVAWPTQYRVVTQRFAANPQQYQQFGLPGHEGIDIQAPSGSPIFAVADGEVYLATTNQGNYGIQVRLLHTDDWTTVYAHLQSTAVQVGQKMKAGDVLGYADATGNSRGSHLHLTLKRHNHTHQDEYGAWPNNIHNPEPFLVAFPNVTWPPKPTKPPMGIDMATYFFPASGNYGDILILKNNWGAGSERMQLQRDGDASYVTKNQLWEKRRIDANGVFLLADTSPGDGQFYTVQGQWLPRRWSPGNNFTRTEKVRFFYKSNCQPVRPEYTSTSTIRFLKLHPTWTSPDNIALQNVIELAWYVGNNVEETYWFAPYLGLCQWKNRHGKHSWAAQVIKRGQAGGEDNGRETLSCL